MTIMTPQCKFDHNSALKSQVKGNSVLYQRRLSFGSWPLLMTLALSSTPGFAELNTAHPPAATKPQASHINVKAVKSNKGITAWIVEAHELPVVSVAIAFKNGGSAEDPKGLSGLVLLLSSMLDEGAGTWDSQEFKKFLLQKNIELAITPSEDVFLVSVRTIRKNVGDAFQILNAILSKPRFDSDTLSRVKNQISSSLEQSLHNEHTVASQKLNSLLYGDHPYGKTIQQTLKEFPTITGDQMRQFMKNRFARNQLLVSAVGDITPEELKDYLDATFGDFPEKASPTTVKDVTLSNLGKTVVEPMDIPQSLIYFTQPGISRSNPDFYAANLLMKIMGDGQFESRLFEEVREKRGLAYGIDAELNWSQHASVILGGTATKSNNATEVMNIIRNVWKKMTQGATQDELDFVKKRMIGSFSLNFSSTIKIAKALLLYQIDNLGIDYINQRNQLIAALTLKDVNRVAESLLNPELLTFVIVGDSKGISTKSTTQEKKL